MNVLKYIRQFACFAVVGASNTAIDLAVTNLLVIATRATSGVALFFISVIACGLATLNSYVLNRRWTFRDTAARIDRGSAAKFMAIALLSMLVNTSTFLFVVRYLPGRTGFSLLLTINIAKLAGVAVAFMVSFLGYRFGVFQTEAVQQFRGTFRFDRSGGAPFLFQLTVLLGLSAVARLGHLFLTTAIEGDAVSYACAAASLASGSLSDVDPGWSSLYCYWQAMFHAAGVGPIASAIAASWIPGLLLIIPAAWMARSLYGAQVAWLAGALCALHPRLIECSGSGGAESFFLLAFTTGAAFFVRMIRRPSLRAALAVGVAFGVSMSVRSEALFAFLLSLPLALLAQAPSAGLLQPIPVGHAQSARVGRMAAVKLMAAALLGLALTVTAYTGLSRATLGASGGFKQTTSLARRLAENLAVRHTATENRPDGDARNRAAERSRTLKERAGMLLQRIPRNWIHVLERMPGVVLSPIPLFALLLPVFASRRTQVPGDEAPLFLMLLFPLLFYPMVQVESRLLFPLLIPLNIFGAAGTWAFSLYGTRAREEAGASDYRPGESPDFRQRPVSTPRMLEPSRAAAFFALLSGILIIASAALSIWRGLDIERGHRHHRQLADWIIRHVDPGEAIAGSGYGYVSTTGYLAGRRTVPLIETAQPSELAGFVRDAGSHWLILYEPILRLMNPELLPVMESELQGFTRVFEVRDDRGQRVQVFQKVDRQPMAGAPFRKTE